MIQFAWDDLRGEPQSEAPSLRLDQFAYATVLGSLTKLFGFSFANAAEFLSLLSSIGLIGAMMLMGYGLTGHVAGPLVFGLFTALFPPLIQTTLNSESESPFYFVTMFGWALTVIYWRRGSYLWLAAAIPLLVVSAGTRGTGLLHLATLCGALLATALVERGTGRSRWIRLAAVLVAALASVGAVTLTKTYVHRRVEHSYVEKLGHVPEFKSYTSYILFDGLVMGPYPQAADWARRQKLVKGIDTATGERHKSLADSAPLDVIRSDPRRYAHNYVVGVYETGRRYLLDPEYNLLGTTWLLLGTLYLVARRRWLALLIAGAWVAVYVGFVPFLAVQARHVRPGSLGLCLPGLLLAAALVQGLYFRPSRRNVPAFWAGTLIGAGVFFYGVTESVKLAQLPPYREPALEASKHIQAAGSSLPIVLSPTSSIVAFGAPMHEIQMIFDPSNQVQRHSIVSVHPDYVFISGVYRKTWGPVFAAITSLLTSGNEPFRGERIFESAGTEVWKVSYEVSPPHESGVPVQAGQSPDPGPATRR